MELLPSQQTAAGKPDYRDNRSGNQHPEIRQIERAKSKHIRQTKREILCKHEEYAKHKRGNPFLLSPAIIASNQKRDCEGSYRKQNPQKQQAESERIRPAGKKPEEENGKYTDAEINCNQNIPQPCMFSQSLLTAPASRHRTPFRRALTSRHSLRSFREALASISLILFS